LCADVAKITPRSQKDHDDGGGNGGSEGSRGLTRAHEERVWRDSSPRSLAVEFVNEITLSAWASFFQTRIWQVHWQ